MRRRPPKFTRTDQLLPYPTLFRSAHGAEIEAARYDGAGRAVERDSAANGVAAIDRRRRNLEGRARRRIERRAAEAEAPRLGAGRAGGGQRRQGDRDRKSTRLNSSH